MSSKCFANTDSVWDNDTTNWCAFQLDSGRLSKRCFFKGVQDRKPVYMFGQQAGGSHKPHTDCKQANVPQSPSNEGLSGVTVFHPIVHDNVKISPERYENTFEKLFRGSAELNMLVSSCEEDPKNQVYFGDGETKKRAQHPSRVIENAQTKARMLEAMGGMRTEGEVEKVVVANESTQRPYRQTFFYNSLDNMSPESLRVVHRNMQESAFWKTSFRSQNIEQGALVDTDKYDFHKIKRQNLLKTLKKPYNTHSTTDVEVETTAQTLEKFKQRSLKSGMSGHGWTIMGKAPPDNLPILAGKQSLDSVVNPEEGIASRLLKDIAKARFIAEKEKIAKPYNEQGLKRSECCWFRKIKTNEILKEEHGLRF